MKKPHPGSEYIEHAGAPPEWPTSPTSQEYGPRLSALATWVEDQLPEATARWGDEIFGYDPAALAEHGWLRQSEKAVLLAAFAKKRGKDRWRDVAAVLRSGKASPRFQAIVAELIDKGGFSPAAKFDSHEAVVTFRDKRLIEKILERNYKVKAKKRQVYDVARDVMAILLKPSVPAPDRTAADDRLVHNQTAAVRDALKLGGDKRRQALMLIRWRVSTEPTKTD